MGRDEKRLADWLDKPAGNFPIARVPSGIKKAINADTEHVFLSADTMTKQYRHHPEMTPEEYAMIPHIIASGEAVFDAPRSAIIIHSADRKRVVVVKSTQAGHEVYVTSFRRVKNNREVNRLQGKGEKIERL